MKNFTIENETNNIVGPRLGKGRRSPVEQNGKDQFTFE